MGEPAPLGIGLEVPIPTPNSQFPNPTLDTGSDSNLPVSSPEPTVPLPPLSPPPQIKASHYGPIPLKVVTWNADGLWQWEADTRDRKANVLRSLLNAFDVTCLAEAHVNCLGD